MKNGAGNGCGTSHFDLRVPINAHNILAPPQLMSVISLAILHQKLTARLTWKYYAAS